jgi:predicted nucleotidyltransferase
MTPLEAAQAATLREHLLIAAAAGYAHPVDQLPDKLSAIGSMTRVLEEQGVRYALIGGLAVGIRSGVPRATLDVDFAVLSTADLDSLSARLRAHDFVEIGRFPHSINFKHASGEPVQLAIDVEFDPMIERAEQLQLGALQLWVVTKEDLIAMKRRAAADPRRRRSKALRDQADIALLEGDVPGDNEGW